jgi:hypothetical protein
MGTSQGGHLGLHSTLWTAARHILCLHTIDAKAAGCRSQGLPLLIAAA